MSIPSGRRVLQKHGQLVSLENQFSDHVSAFVMPNSLNVSGLLAIERIPLYHCNALMVSFRHDLST